MTDLQWRSAEDPMAMLNSIRKNVSNRKLRLFAVACCRNVWAWLPKYSRIAVEVAERYADKDASKSELFQARKDIVYDDILRGYSDCATGCAWHACAWRLWGSVAGVIHTTAITPRTIEWERVVEAEQKTEAMFEAARIAGQRSRHSQTIVQCQIVRDIFNPSSNYIYQSIRDVRQFADYIYSTRDFSLMPMLADALQDSGCNDLDILTHCREQKLHSRGCYVLDALTGRR